ncbi:MAG: deaminase [Homoserinimonas sp.]|nr:deaminase [Homoserinimonas sp.]
MRSWTAQLERADALLFGRVTYEMMARRGESRPRAPRPDRWMNGKNPSPRPLQLKRKPGEGLWVGGVTLPWP